MKIVYKMHKPNFKGGSFRASSLRIDKIGDCAEECGSMGLGHINERKRIHCCLIFFLYI